ncbi:UNVERIFIED_CONTAM: Protein tyrosine phosphatase type IVA 1 [Siphonaria sp. JEL0065]|nr:Protein tyrosine phosphatase type IVA 1 [Siphonaria sp. JEL0065]
MPAKTNIPMNRVMSTIDYKNMRFVVFDAPTDANVELYLDELLVRNVSDIVRVCEPTYRTDIVNAAGIQVTDWGFADGTVPPPAVITGFLNLCNDRFPGGLAGTASYQGDVTANGVKAIGIHCVAGLGRAPILVAIALIESGMAPIEAVEYIRSRRRGAFNTVQLNYLVEVYKRSYLRRGVGLNTVTKKSSGWFSKKERGSSPTGSSNGSAGVLAEHVPDVHEVSGQAATVTGAAAPAKSFKSWFSKKT